MHLLPLIQVSHPDSMSPSTPTLNRQSDKPHGPNHKSQSDKFTIINHNTLKDKLSNSPTPTDKVKIGTNINQVIK